MQWHHPIGGEYGGFNHKLQGVSLRIWRPLHYQVTHTTTKFGASSTRIVPETEAELVENLSLLSQRAFTERITEKRLCTVNNDGLFDLLEENE